jgi:NRPS condensation-like uncharacterized protein
MPLSPLQQGMLFHHLLEPHSGVDIEQIVVHLPEPIDARHMGAAWQWLVQRHDILRARFAWDGVDPPHLEILSEVPTSFAVETARDLSADDRCDRLRSFLEADRVLGFELDRAPLLRLTLFEWDEASFTLVWTFHHALLDGRTFPILLREVFEAYEELTAPGALAPRAAPPAYRRHLE